MDISLFDITLWLLTLVLVVLIVTHAWNHGVAPLLWISLSWGAALVAAGFAYRGGSSLFEQATGTYLRFMPAAVMSVLAALIVFLLVRLLARAILDWASEPERFCAGMFYGFGAAVLALVPAFIAILTLVFLIRGTAAVGELRHVDEVSRHQDWWSVERYPRLPIILKWRDATEKIPGAVRVYDLADPISTKSERNVAALLLAANIHAANQRLKETGSTAQILTHPRFQQARATSAVAKLLDVNAGNWVYLRLLRRPELSDALSDPEFRLMVENISAARDIRHALTGT